ncbi:uncharacterized protein LOC130644476 isoform X2 [Hydractinia symbiolongicarpus]|uniref:uncharacterized protein LOC130644476 isoform X2 n=1 Tax=Hydractinia symbiolongicarpus TaxID=13093 RepID=UPI00254E1654|nr:uncharacterized protein LOC130644476 isoform X2 [Hydractinia symbiolongicarpus]
MISSIAAKCDLVVGKWPCGDCRKGVGSNSIFCQTCKHWVHKKCSSIGGRLRADIQFVCKRCKGEIIENEVFPASMMYNSGSLEIVENFCYLVDMLGSEGGVGRSVTCRIGSAWKKFRELLPLLTSRVLSIEVKGRLYEACIRSVMLYGSETWAVKQEDLDRLERNDMRMVSSSELFLSLRLALHIHLTILISFLTKRSRSSCFTAHVSLPYNITLLKQGSYNLPFKSIDKTLLVNKESSSLNFFQAEPILQVTLLPTPPLLPNMSPK